jgi:predicted alpha/beta superfamily hydrolase
MRQVPYARGKIYLDVGAAEGIGLVEGGASQQTLASQYLAQVRKINQLLLGKGYRTGHDLLYVEEEGGIHHESAWARRLPAALRFLLSGIRA